MAWQNIKRNMGNKSFLLAGIFFSLVLSACSFDNNEDYVLETKAGLFLTQDSTGKKSLHRVEKDTTYEGWNVSAFGIQDADLGDMQGQDNELWVSDITHKKIIGYHLAKKERTDNFSTGALIPHYICVGDKYILLSDTVARKIGYLKRSNGDLTIWDIGYRSGKAAYKLQRFYLPADHRLFILSEPAISEITHHLLQNTPFEMAFDNRTSGFLYAKRNDTLLVSGVDILTGTLQNDNTLPRESPAGYDKIRFTPYRVATFGKELTTNLILANHRIGYALPNGGIQDFEADFFESKVYYKRNDTLYRQHLSLATPEYAHPFQAQFLGAHFYRDFSGR